MNRRWSVLVVRVPRGFEEEVAAALADRGLGAEVEGLPSDHFAVRVYLEDEVDTQEWIERARFVLDAHGLPSEGIRLEPVEDGHWVERYQEALRPILLGRRFVVVPGDGFQPVADREALKVVPGMAFGTGEHPTTRLCAQALETAVEAGQSWMDLGTGTGVLAWIAGRCGAARVLAVDPDPEAIRVAREVIRGSGEAGRIEIRRGSTEARRGETFHGVVANVAASLFLREAVALAECVNPGGTVLAAGFLREDVDDVASAFRAGGLQVVDVVDSLPWSLIRALRIPA